MSCIPLESPKEGSSKKCDGVLAPGVGLEMPNEVFIGERRSLSCHDCEMMVYE